VQPAPQPPHRLLPELLLAAAGITPDDIDIVTYSHAHADHVAGGIVFNSTGSLVPTFPHARYLIRERELAHQRGSENYDTFFAPLEEAGLLEAIPSDGDYPLTQDVVLMSGYEGHTPGLQITRVASQTERAYFIGDALHVLLQFSMPQYSPSFDFAVEQSVPSRRRLLDRLQAEGALLVSPHLPFPGVGHVVGAGLSRSFAPLELPAIAEGGKL
jgi:glyoxylase-like metal-dependent hydrolase (beta-lactamase superfamily II)